MSGLWYVLQVFMLGLALTGAVVAVRQLLASYRAERQLVAAMHHSPDRDRLMSLLTDLVAEQRLLNKEHLTTVERAYLADAMRDLIIDMEKAQRLSERNAKVLQSGLQQPSEVGRQAYARKLAREALRKPELIEA